MNTPLKEFTLVRRMDRVMLRFADGGDELPVRLLWARPVYGRGQEISLLDDKKREVLMIAGPECLDPESRRIAEDEFARRYLIPRITRVFATEAHFGNRCWHVLTDAGERRFAMKDPVLNAMWVTDDHLVIRDSLGSRYEVKPFSGLDAVSQAEVLKII